MNADDHFEPKVRAAEKQASRDEDAAALASGTKSRDDLHRENGVFALLKVRPDFAASYARRSSWRVSSRALRALRIPSTACPSAAPTQRDRLPG